MKKKLLQLWRRWFPLSEAELEEQAIPGRIMQKMWNRLEESNAGGQRLFEMDIADMQEHIEQLMTRWGYEHKLVYTGEMYRCPHCGALYQNADIAEQCCPQMPDPDPEPYPPARPR